MSITQLAQLFNGDFIDKVKLKCGIAFLIKRYKDLYRGEVLVKGYKVLVLQDESVLDMCYTA